MQIEDVRIGASEVAAALGHSPYCSPMRWWAEKVGRVDRSGGSTSTELGNALEAGVADLFAKGHRVVLTPGADIRDPQLEWMAATPDRLIEPDGMTAAFKEQHGIEDDEVVLLEIKTTALGSYIPPAQLALEWGAEGSRDIPLHYGLQVQQQIAVVDAALREAGVGFCRRAIVKALIPGRGVPEFIVDGDPEARLFIRESLVRVVDDFLLPEVPFSPQSEDDWKLAEALRERAFRGKSATRAMNEAEALVFGDYIRTRDAVNEAKREHSKARLALIEAIGDDYAITGPRMRASYSAGRDAIKTNAVAALAEAMSLARLQPPDVREAFESILSKHTMARRTSRRLTVRFDDRPSDEDQSEEGDTE